MEFNNGLKIVWWRTTHTVTITAPGSVVVESTPPTSFNHKAYTTFFMCSVNGCFGTYYGTPSVAGNVAYRINSIINKSKDACTIYIMRIGY